MGWVIRPETIKAIRPLEKRNSFKWIKSKIRTPTGLPFKWFDYPWTRGICDAWDDPHVRQITMQFAARLGKTFIANSLMISALEYDPANGMVAMPTEPLLRDMIRDKYYKMLEKCFETSNLIPIKANRTQSRIDMTTAVVYGAWSGSPSTLADKDPKYKHGGEIDKMDSSASDEADPLDLFLERGIEIPDRKTIIESTPALLGSSRVESHLIQGWNARFQVPCPKCSEFIELIDGAEGVEGGIKFELDDDGKYDKSIAKRTARYQCQICGKNWDDSLRRPAIQKGIWVPAGMHIENGKLVGEMVGDYENASFQLSRIYAPTFTFGDIAGAIADCHQNPNKWQNYRNSWMGKTYQARKATKEWDEVGERLAGDYEMMTVPVGGIFLTMGVDVQADKFVYVVTAWGHDCVGWVVDYGNCYSIAELKDKFSTKYEHVDGGPRLGISIALMDSGEGERQDEIFDLCKTMNRDTGPWMWPCKGSSGSIVGGKPYRQQTLEELNEKKKRDRKRKKGIKGLFHITVNTPFFQSWIQAALHYRTPGDGKSLSLPIEAKEDEDFLRQIINEGPEDSVSNRTGHSQKIWVVIDESCPWDFRDAIRYSRCAGEVYTRGAWNRIAKKRTIKAVSAPLTEGNKPSKPKRNRTSKPSPRKESRFVRAMSNNRFSKR